MKEIQDIIKKLKANELLTDSERELLVETIKAQSDCIKYYSQDFVGTWDCDEVNVNWRAKKCIKQIEDKIEETTVVIDVCPVVKTAKKELSDEDR